MKKLLYLSILTLVLLVLAACSAASQTDAETTTGESTDATGTNPAGELSTNVQLALGAFALEETEYAITPEQAGELLPLWKAAQALSDSETITTEEIQAVFNQIEETMTTEQMNAITSMELTQETMAEIGEKYGLTFGAGGGGFDPFNLTDEQLATREAFQESGQAPGGGGFPGGGPPEGGFPGGGPGGGDIGSLPEAQQTAIASGAGRFGGGNGGLPSAFYDAIIEFLQGKVQ